MADSDNARSAGPGAPGDSFPWPEVRRLYEESDWPVPDICDHYGISLYALREARIAGGWVARRSAAPPGSNRGARPASPKGLATRLAKALSAHVAALEGRLAERAEAGAAPDEADMRTITDMAQALERLARVERTNMRKRAERRGGGRARDAHASRERPDADGFDPAHVAWMRAELKRRLDVLARSAEGGAGPGDRRDEGAGP